MYADKNVLKELLIKLKPWLVERNFASNQENINHF